MKRRRRRAYRGNGDWGVLFLCAAATAIVLLLPSLHDAWRQSMEGAARALTMEEARETNASIPFVPELGKARPFHIRGSSAAREQAVQCLATAAVYEAGNDESGRRAVMQVVLNRVGRPPYPKTVCGVVYEGSLRPTGCQFSFACDGSVVRRPEREGWPEARSEAERALSGYVFAPVGTATHYHTDWTVPYWIGSLDKVAQVRTHIFYAPHNAAPPSDSPDEY